MPLSMPSCYSSRTGAWLGALCCLWLLFTLSVSQKSHARPIPPKAQLETAIDVYNHGGYLEAAALLNKLLYPLKLSETDDIVRAKVYLGLSYYILDRREYAEQEFRGIFKIDPQYQPDPLYIPEEAIEFIEGLRPPPPTHPNRTDVLGLGERIGAPDNEPTRFSPANLLPLGIPQLRNGDNGRGVTLMATELALLALNVGSYYFLEKYNDPDENSQEIYPILQTAKVTNISSFSLLAAVVAYGIGDALYRYPAPDVTLNFGVVPGPEPGVFVSFQHRF